MTVTIELWHVWVFLYLCSCIFTVSMIAFAIRGENITWLMVFAGFAWPLFVPVGFALALTTSTQNIIARLRLKKEVNEFCQWREARDEDTAGSA